MPPEHLINEEKNRLSRLKTDDFFVLYQPFHQEVSSLFPFPVQVEFAHLYNEKQTWLQFFGVESPSVKENICSIFCSLQEKNRPLLYKGDLYFSLPLREDGTLFLVVQGLPEDQAHLYTQTVLFELQAQIFSRLQNIRLIFLEPETGLYNQRALQACYPLATKSGRGSLLLFRFVFPYMDISSSKQKSLKTGRLLSVNLPGVIFSLGQDVYAVLSPYGEQKSIGQQVHRLQHSMKRTGVSKLPGAGISLYREADHQDDSVLDFTDFFSCLWQALVQAEKRGPFGLYIQREPEEKICDPFIPSPTLEKAFQKASRGIQNFQLLVYFSPQKNPLRCPSQMESLLKSGEITLLTEASGALYFFLPISSTSPDQTLLSQVTATIQEAHPQHQVSVAVSSWPYGPFTKKQALGNCLRIMYQSQLFSEPGSTTFFDHTTFHVTGDYYFDLGDYKQALSEYQNGLKIQGHDMDLLNSLGVTLVELNQLKKALTTFEKVLYLDSSNYMARVNMGQVNLTLNRKEEALKIFEHAWRLAQKHNAPVEELYTPLSRLYCGFGQYKKALAILDHWFKQPERRADFLLFRFLAKACFHTDKKERAIEHFQHALQANPYDALSMSYLGLLYVEQGQGNELGLSLLQRAIELNPQETEGYIRLGEAYLLMKKPDRALDSLRVALARDERHAKGLTLATRACRALGDKQGALLYSQQAKKQQKAKAA